MKNKLIVIWLLIIGGISSCELIWNDKDPVNSYESNFDILWSILNERYSFFEYKNIDWDASYQSYKSRAISATNEQEFFDILTEMLSELRDGHVNIRSPFDISRFQQYLDAPSNFNYDLLERNYLEGSRITGHLLNHEIQGVGYIYYRSFTNPITNFELDTVINRFKNLPGIIIDIRNNEGGNPSNGLKILARIISERTNIYNSQFKNGTGRTDFTEIEKVFLDPYTDGPTFTGKIVVLTNRRVFSAGSYFSAAMKNIDNAILMGDDTGGGSGVPAGFELPNGWYFNYSSSIGYTAQGLNFESGVPVDIKVDLNPIDVANNRDTILEAAIRYIKN